MNYNIIMINERIYKTTLAQRQAQSRYIKKNKDKSNLWCKQYYERNKESIKLKRKEKKAAQALLKLSSKVII
jgi:hypothetical protein